MQRGFLWMACSACAVVACGRLTASVDVPDRAAASAPPGDASLDLVLPSEPLACEPADMSAFQPSFVPPTDPQPGACDSPDEIALVTDCLTRASLPPQACADVRERTRDVTCADCVVTAVDAGRHGPVIMDGFVARLNVAGCIALFTRQGRDDPGCGGWVAALEDCAFEACRGCGAIDAGASYDGAPHAPETPALEACLMAARRGTCVRFVDRAERCLRPVAGGPSAVCQGVGDFIKRAVALGSPFCLALDAGAPPDGGGD